MVSQVNTQLTLDGELLKQFSQFSLTQSLSAHHCFELICPTEALDGKGDLLQDSRHLLGAPLHIQVQPVVSAGQPAGGSMQFLGLITEVQTVRSGAHAGQLLISGHSPTILLDDGPHCQSWSERSILQIAEQVLEGFPRRLLDARVQPSYTDPIAYAVQYQQTAWQWLTHLASRYGEWIYYDGSRLHLAAPSAKAVPLTFGQDLQRFGIGLRVRPTRFAVRAYDYVQHHTYNARPQEVTSLTGLSDFGQHALKKSQSFYVNYPREWHPHTLPDLSQVDRYVGRRATAMGSQLVTFKGESNHCGLVLGQGVNVTGYHAYNQRKEGYGEYTVVALTHQFSATGDYQNTFEAIPASVKVSPVAASSAPPCPTQAAKVTDNHDPAGLGRIRVRFDWMEAGLKSPWIRVSSGYGGSDKGMFFLPEVSESVLVGFVGDDAEQPYVLGSVWHGGARTGFANERNDIKAIKTRSGHLVEFDDAKETVKITNAAKPTASIVVSFKDKGDVSIAAEGNIQLTAGKKITMQAEDILLEATKSYQLKAGEVKEGVEKDKEVNVRGSIKQHSRKKEETTQDFVVKASGKADIQTPDFNHGP